VGANGVGRGFGEEEGGDGNVAGGSVIGEGGEGCLARGGCGGVGGGVGLAVGVGAEAGVVGDEECGGAGLLGVSDFLYEGAAASAVCHEDVGGGPGFHDARFVFGAGGVAFSSVYVGVAEVGIGVVEWLHDGGTVLAVGARSEEGFAVVVSAGDCEG